MKHFSWQNLSMIPWTKHFLVSGSEEIQYFTPIIYNPGMRQLISIGPDVTAKMRVRMIRIVWPTHWRTSMSVRFSTVSPLGMI